MLEKIVNITPGSDYKQASKPARYSNISNFASVLNSSLNDSISLSPATAFLSSVNWKLRKLQNDKDRVLIVFEFDGFEFLTQIHLSDLSRLSIFDFDIKKHLENYSNKTEVYMKIISPIDQKLRENIDPKFNLPALNQFIDEIVAISSFRYSISEDNAEVKEIFYEHENNIRAEFNYIGECLKNFLEKFLSVKLFINQSFSNPETVLLLKKLGIK